MRKRVYNCGPCPGGKGETPVDLVHNVKEAQDSFLISLQLSTFTDKLYINLEFYLRVSHYTSEKLLTKDCSRLIHLIYILYRI